MKKVQVPSVPQRKDSFDPKTVIHRAKSLNYRPKQRATKIRRKAVKVYACGHANPIMPNWNGKSIIYVYVNKRCSYCNRSDSILDPI